MHKSHLEPVRERLAKANVKPLVSAILPDGRIVETLYDSDKGETRFCIGNEDRWEIAKDVRMNGHTAVPYSPQNNLVQNEIVLFPSAIEEYGTEESLVSEIQSFIHRYVDVSPHFEQVASYYVLFTWVYDAFNELPYLRARGDYGSGKTRFLLTIGSLCYKPIFASGASTVSPLFRMLDTFRGTLIIDECDFRWSDERAELVKILNNGNARGFPVLRSETTPQKEFNPRAYSVFGPKLVATRGHFEDQALESRFLTEEMGVHPLRHDVPINLPNGHREEACHLRNKLLLFRLRNRHKKPILDGLMERSIEPRLQQVFAPLLSMVKSPESREALKKLARGYHQDLLTERGLGVEAQVLEVIRDLLAGGQERITVKDVSQLFSDRFGDEHDRKITSKWIGSIIRRKLRLSTHKSNGVFVLSTSAISKSIQLLGEKYGVSVNPNILSHRTSKPSTTSGK